MDCVEESSCKEVIRSVLGVCISRCYVYMLFAGCTQYGWIFLFPFTQMNELILFCNVLANVVFSMPSSLLIICSHSEVLVKGAVPMAMQPAFPLNAR